MSSNSFFGTLSSVVITIFFFYSLDTSCMARLGFVPTDEAFLYQFAIPEHTYHAYCSNVYSQGGEDGIVQQLLKELAIERGTVCEFGAADGIITSNTYNLIKNYQFSGMVIEADPVRYAACMKNYAAFPNVGVFNGFVLYDDAQYNLDAWLTKGNLPKDFDVLSIDIDGDDYYVWKNLTTFQPKIVIIETNPYRDPVFDELPGIPSEQYNIDLLKEWHPGRVALGSSFISIIKLGLQKGYIPVAYTGNVVFVRKDLMHHLKEFPHILSDDPYDYLGLYTHIFRTEGNRWRTNTGLLLNAAIRDYYVAFKKKYIDVDWLRGRVQEIMRHEQVVF